MRLLLSLALTASLAMGAALSAPAGAQEAGGGRPALTGAGSSLGQEILARWAASYGRATGAAPDGRSPLTYESVGSLGGTMRVKDHAVNFGISEIPLPATELARLGLVQFPIAAGGIVVAVHLDNVPRGALRLSGPVLADIFLGRVTSWSDPAIAALNPALPLPAAPIEVVHRLDSSGTTFNATSFLSATSSVWKDTVGAGPQVKWPVGTALRGNDSIALKVRRTPNSIGFVQFAQVLELELNHASIRNHSGRFVRPEPRGFQAAATAARWSSDNHFAVALTDAPGELSYPISVPIFALLPKGVPIQETRTTLGFFRWALENGGSDATALGYVALPRTMVEQIRDYWRKNLGSAS